jgi:hypothetical protein
MVKCPSCKQPAMTLWRKLNSGPLSRVPCASCGKRLRNSWWSPVVVMLGTLIGGLAVRPLPSMDLAFVAIVAAAVVSLVVLAYVVPIVGRDDA